jgi:hypothetical protein
VGFSCTLLIEENRMPLTGEERRKYMREYNRKRKEENSEAYKKKKEYNIQYWRKKKE